MKTSNISRNQFQHRGLNFSYLDSTPDCSSRQVVLLIHGFPDSAHPELKQAMREQGFQVYLAKRKAEELMDSMQDTLEGAKEKADQMSEEFKDRIEDWLESGAVSGVKKGQTKHQSI